MYDTNVRYHIDNNECYTAPWINLDKVLEKAVKKSLISKENVTLEDSAIFEKQNITMTEFEHLFNTYTNLTMADVFSSSNNLYEIPLFETQNAGMTLDIDG